MYAYQSAETNNGIPAVTENLQMRKRFGFMWIHVEKDSLAFNTAHVSRLFVEQTGSGAALKAEVAGKIHMIAYVTDKESGRLLLREMMEAANQGKATFVVTTGG